MFFVLSKILLFLIKPLVWVVLLLLRAIFSKDEAKKKRRLVAATVILFVFSNSFLMNELMLVYEDNGTENLDSTYQVGLVLGGFSTRDPKLGRTVFYEANDRLMQALRLYYEGRIRRIMITSGNSGIIDNAIKEGDAVRDYLHSIHFPDSALIIENQSRNTIENFSLSYKILDSMGIKTKPLVITSAWHIPRARLCTRDRHADFYATNYMSNGKRDYSPFNLLVPSGAAMNNAELLLKELFGYAVYFVKAG